MFRFFSHIETSVGYQKEYLEYNTLTYLILKPRSIYSNAFVALVSVQHTDYVIHPCVFLIYIFVSNFLNAITVCVVVALK